MKSVQYCGGYESTLDLKGNQLRVFSTVGNTVNTWEGNYQYYGGIPLVLRRIFSIVEGNHISPHTVLIISAHNINNTQY